MINGLHVFLLVLVVGGIELARGFDIVTGTLLVLSFTVLPLGVHYWLLSKDGRVAWAEHPVPSIIVLVATAFLGWLLYSEVGRKTDWFDAIQTYVAACILVWPVTLCAHLIADRVFRVYKPKTPQSVGPHVHPAEAFSGLPAAPLPQESEWASSYDRAFDFDPARFEHHYPPPQHQALPALPRMIDATPVLDPPQHDQWQSRPTSDAEWSDVQGPRDYEYQAWQNEAQERTPPQAAARQPAPPAQAMPSLMFNPFGVAQDQPVVVQQRDGGTFDFDPGRFNR